MSAFATLRSLAFMSIITGGLVTASWNSVRHVSWLHDHDRGDVVWIATTTR
jgi:hypothetical protein